MTDRHTGTSLLPPNAPRVMTALSLVSAEHRDLIPWDDLPRVFDPATCPARLLPWLATVFSVDVWFEEWSEARKRDVIARAIPMHRLKGTLAGVEEYLALVDARVVRATTPPSLFWLSDFGDAEYRVWLDRLPEVRVYHWTTTATEIQTGALTTEPEVLPEDYEFEDAVEHYLGDPDAIEDEDVPVGFALEPEEPVRLAGLRAVLIQGGVETELGIETENEFGARDGVVADVERLFFPETIGDGFVLAPPEGDGAFLDAAFATDASDRRYVAFVRRSRTRVAEMGSATVRGREVVDDDPERVFTDTLDPGTWFLDDPNDQWFLADDFEILPSYFDRWRIVDPAVSATHGGEYSYLDHDRFSIPPYTAELLIDLPEVAPLDQWFLDATPIGFIPDSDFSALWNACDVTVVATSERDDVLLDLDFDRPKRLRQVYSLRDLKLR